MGNQIIFTLGRDGAEKIQDSLRHAGVIISLKVIRSLDGEVELIKILVSGGQHLINKLIDHLAQFVASVLKRYSRNTEDMDTDEASKVSSQPSVQITITLGDMKLSLENAPLDKVLRIIKEFEDSTSK